MRGLGDVGHEGFVELEDGLGWLFLEPERLGEFQAGEVIPWATFFPVLAGVGRGEVGRSWREVGIHPRGWKFLWTALRRF